MVLSANNRKSFPLNLTISPLARSSSRDPSASQPDRSSPSRVSYLSPRSPLFPSSLHLKQDQPVIPIPLSDGLDPSERMKLLRKSRKLSRILGEVPIPVPKDGPSRPADSRSFSVLKEPPLTSASTAASSSPAKTPLEVDAKGSLRRSATVGHNRHAQHTEIHRTRSLACLRPSLTIPPAAITVHPSPISPVVFAWPEQNSIPPSPFSVETPSEGFAPESACSARESIASESSRRSSITSTISGAERTPEQIQRARAAKLTRQLGNNVPPDVLLRASSPPPRSPLSSPSVVSFAEASHTIQHASSTRRANRGERRDLKRPLSLDVRNYVRVPEPPEPSPSLSDADNFSTVRPNSKPIWAERKGSAPAATRPYDTDVEESRTDLAQHDSDLDSDFEDDDVHPLTLEKQRALNVRRARKMLQLFGNDPPPALFQIMNIPPSAPDEGISVALSIAHRRNDSRATTVSLPASTLSVPESRHQQRDSVGSIASSGENLSPLIFADPGSVPPSQPQTPQPRRDAQFLPPLPALTPSQDTVFEICRPLSVPTAASSSVQSLSAASSTSVATSSTDRAPTPPPKDQTPQTSPFRTSFNFSPPPTMWLWSPASASAPSPPPTAAPAVLPEPAADVHPSDPHFRVRRMRAAKLSRFFGVGLNDIAGVIRGGASASLSHPSPPSPPLREFRRSDSTDSIPSPAGSDRASSRTSSTRPITSSGIVRAPSIEEEEEPWPRARMVSTTTRSRSVSRTSRRPQTQPVLQPATERNRSNSQPEVLGPAALGRAFSTTVEVAAESKGPFGFLDGRRPSKVKELHMHDVIRELRKIK